MKTVKSSKNTLRVKILSTESYISFQNAIKYKRLLNSWIHMKVEAQIDQISIHTVRQTFNFSNIHTTAIVVQTFAVLVNN